MYMENNIEWRDIPEYEGYYKVSNTGIVMSLIKRKGSRPSPYMNGTINTAGYRVVNLSKDGKYKTKLVHVLVAQAFIPNPNNLSEVCHRDDNPSNSHVDNLFWGTHKDNVEDMVKKGRGQRGEGHYMRILTEDNVREIRSRYTGRRGQQKELADEFGVHKETLREVVNFTTWKHVEL